MARRSASESFGAGTDKPASSAGNIPGWSPDASSREHPPASCVTTMGAGGGVVTGDCGGGDDGGGELRGMIRMWLGGGTVIAQLLSQSPERAGNGAGRHGVTASASAGSSAATTG